MGKEFKVTILTASEKPGFFNSKVSVVEEEVIKEVPLKSPQVNVSGSIA